MHFQGLRGLKTQQLRALAALPDNLGSRLSTHMAAHNYLQAQNLFFWPLPALHICRVLTHKIKIIKSFLNAFPIDAIFNLRD